MQRCLIFDLKLLDVGRLRLGGFDPFLHLTKQSGLLKQAGLLRFARNDGNRVYAIAISRGTIVNEPRTARSSAAHRGETLMKSISISLRAFVVGIASMLLLA